MDKVLLEKMFEEEMSQKDIAKKLGKSYSSVRYWVSKHGLEPDNRRGRRWKKEEMESAIKSSVTISDVLRKIGLSLRPGNFETIKKFIKENNIDASHITGRRSSKGGSLKKELSEILVKESDYSRHHLKKRLLDEGLLRNKCSECDLDGLWNGKEIKMVLDHINGVNNDNRLENLRMLCPNCNSQQKTFCRK